jgi:isocitrate/isopropylmalate dehydrogenase
MYQLWTIERVRETNALFVKASIDAYGTPLTEETLAAAKAADAVILGAVGGPVIHPHSRSPPTSHPAVSLTQAVEMGYRKSPP